MDLKAFLQEHPEPGKLSGAFCKRALKAVGRPVKSNCRASEAMEEYREFKRQKLEPEIEEDPVVAEEPAASVMTGAEEPAASVMTGAEEPGVSAVGATTVAPLAQMYAVDRMDEMFKRVIADPGFLCEDLSSQLVLEEILVQAEREGTFDICKKLACMIFLAVEHSLVSADSFFEEKGVHPKLDQALEPEVLRSILSAHHAQIGQRSLSPNIFAATAVQVFPSESFTQETAAALGLTVRKGEDPLAGVTALLSTLVAEVGSLKSKVDDLTAASQSSAPVAQESDGAELADAPPKKGRGRQARTGNAVFDSNARRLRGFFDSRGIVHNDQVPLNVDDDLTRFWEQYQLSLDDALRTELPAIADVPLATWKEAIQKRIKTALTSHRQTCESVLKSIFPHLPGAGGDAFPLAMFKRSAAQEADFEGQRAGWLLHSIEDLESLHSYFMEASPDSYAGWNAYQRAVLLELYVRRYEGYTMKSLTVAKPQPQEPMSDYVDWMARPRIRTQRFSAFLQAARGGDDDAGGAMSREREE